MKQTSSAGRSSKRRPVSTIKRAAIYARVSTDMQAQEGESIPAQLDRLRRWAAENGYVVVAEYVDEGQSARTADRREFARMLQDAKAAPRPYDAILVVRWDRFARNVDDASMFKTLIRRQLGMELISISDPQLGGAIGTLMERILDVIAEFQSLLTAENVKNTMCYLAEGGRWLGKVPFGYALSGEGKLVPKEGEAEAVRWAFEQIALRQSSIQGIAAEFATGIRFPATLKYKWSQQAIRQILRNPVYIGTVSWNKRYTQIANVNGRSQKLRGFRDPSEWITIEDAHEPIISKQLWHDAQRVMDEIGARYADRKSNPPWLFQGLVRCARCDSKFTWYHPHDTRPKVSCQRYFRMRNSPSRCLPWNWIRPAELQAAVIQEMRALVDGNYEVEAVEIVSPQRQQARRSLESAIAANRERLRRLLDGYEAGLYTLDEVKERRQALDAEYARLISTPASQSNGASSEEEIETLRQRVAEALAVLEDESVSVETRNVIATGIIDRITVDRENATIAIRWRLGDYGDG